MTRLLAFTSLLFCAGCGSVLAPSLIGIPGLSSDAAPGEAASVAVVTASAAPGRTASALDGRVVDRDTGAPLAGIRLGSGETTDADGAFRLPAGSTSLRAEAACYAPLDAAVGADAVAVLVLMAPAGC